MIVLFSIFLMPIFSFAKSGTFIIVKNDVKLQKKNGASELAKVGSAVQIGDTIISGADSRAKIAMQDRNIISVLPNSKLVIEDYKVGENDRNVKLSLLQGKVRNDVKEKYDNINKKFQIRTPTAVAGVRGTQFITGYNIETKATEIITLKGQVEVTKFAINSTTPIGTVVINQGEKGTIENNSEAPQAPQSIPKPEVQEADSGTSVKKDKPSDGSGGTSGESANQPPLPPRPPRSPNDGIKTPGQLPPFIINNPNTGPGKVKTILIEPKQ